MRKRPFRAAGSGGSGGGVYVGGMTTKWGMTALVVGAYLLTLGIAGINANSGGGAVAVFAVLLVVGFVVAGWSILLPWDGGHKARGAQDAPGPVPTR